MNEKRRRQMSEGHFALKYLQLIVLDTLIRMLDYIPNEYFATTVSVFRYNYIVETLFWIP